MTSTDYQCNIQAPVTSGEALDKISRVPEWWAADFNGSARQPGDTFTVRFGETFVDFRISEVVPERKVVWEVINCQLPWLRDKTEWTGTSIVWEVSAGNGAASVTMTHQGLAPGIECYDACKQGWDFYVATSLRQFLTEGKGLPEGEGRASNAASVA